MKKGRGFIGFVIIASVVAAALTGCSQDSGVLASDSNYSAVNVNVSMDYDALGSQIAYEYNTGIKSGNLSVEPIVYSGEGMLSTDSNGIIPLLETSNFFAVRFLPERVYNPENIFSFRAVSLESLKSMYRDLNEKFDYALMIPFGLGYIGNFNRDVNFVERLPNTNANDFINRRMYNADGSIGSITPIRAVGLGRTLYQGFDGGISEGRNLTEADFYKNAPDQAISVVLGNAYKQHYNVGDTFQLQMNWQMVDFKVVGFFKHGVGIADSGAGFGDGTFDYTIVMPLFSIGYEPTDDDNFIFQTFHYNYLVSGFIRINEPIDADTHNMCIDTITEIHAGYRGKVMEMAERNGLVDAFYLNMLPASLELLGFAETR